MPRLLHIPNSAATAYQLLFIDNSEKVQEATLCLTKYNYTLASSCQATQLLRQNKYSCIFVASKLLLDNNFAFLKSITALDATTPILGLATPEEEPLLEQALSFGLTDWLFQHQLTAEHLAQSVRYAIKLKQAELKLQLAQDQLDSNQAQLEFLVANTPAAFWQMDAQGKFKYAHGIGFSMIGVDASNIIRKSFEEVLSAHPRIIDRFHRALSGEVVQSVDETKNHFFKARYSPDYDVNGNIVGVTGFAIDVTEMIKKERELMMAKEVAEDSARVKEQFLANISHEIRTPMNGIIGLANLLRKTQLDQEQQKYLNAIRKSADNLMHIIGDLLDFSKISAERFTFEDITFNLQELVQDVVDLMENKAKERDNSLHTFIDANVPAQVSGDPLRLRQVILNLVGNAIKFTEHGEIKLQVKLLSDSDHELVVEFIVEDTGIGIPSDKLEAVFESFNQGSNDTTRKYGGTGLGLTISKNIVELQGGTISVRSQPQVGSTFSFSIPFKKVPLTELLTPTAAIEEEEDTYLNELTGLRILLAEDNEINLLLTTTVLTNWGVETDTACNGLEALEKLFSKPYDLVLMDMQMPEMDGYEAIEMLRGSDAVNRQLPVIALTAHTSQSEIQKCIMAGANAYISKPYDTDDLFKAIVRLISKEGKYKGASLNMKSLKGMAGNNTSFLLEVLQMYIESTPAAVRKLYKLTENEQLNEAHVALSELYDSISVISAKPLQFTFERMANALHEKDLPLLKQSAALAITECDKLMELLRQEYKNAKQPEEQY